MYGLLCFGRNVLCLASRNEGMRATCRLWEKRGPVIGSEGRDLHVPPEWGGLRIRSLALPPRCPEDRDQRRIARKPRSEPTFEEKKISSDICVCLS